MVSADVKEVSGSVMARDKDIGRAAAVQTPMRVLEGMERLPRIVRGKVLAGETEGVKFLDYLPRKEG